MKKLFLFGGLLTVFMMSACSLRPRLYQQQPPSNIATSVVPPSDVGVPVYEEPIEEFMEGAYVENVGCGYLSISPKPESNVLYLVCDEEDIEAAEKVLGMKVPDDADWAWDYESNHIEAFQNMKKNYPIEEYNYLFLYEEHSCLGYSSHADGIFYNDANHWIYFHYDVIKRPAEGEAVCDAMDGEFKIAAVPKVFFEGRTFGNVTRPSELTEYDQNE